MLDMDALKRIGINTEEGLAYCADDPEFSTGDDPKFR